jgi:hypothetical protein
LLHIYFNTDYYLGIEFPIVVPIMLRKVQLCAHFPPVRPDHTLFNMTLQIPMHKLAPGISKKLRLLYNLIIPQTQCISLVKSQTLAHIPILSTFGIAGMERGSGLLVRCLRVVSWHDCVAADVADRKAG